jgi:flagellar basal-body rod protein FlgB
MSSMIRGDSLNAAKAALDGLSLRQQMISRNIANVDTPGYVAQDISFEQTIKQALKKAEQSTLSVSMTNARHLQPLQTTGTVTTVNRPGGSTRVDGNNVDIDTELSQMNEVGLRYQALTQMVSRSYSMIKSITASR